MKKGEIILKQLGGANKIKAMIGTKIFLEIENGVSFRFKGSKKFNAVNIEIVNDIYIMTFYKIVGVTIKKEEKFTDIYAESLKSLFQDKTELFLSL